MNKLMLYTAQSVALKLGISKEAVFLLAKSGKLNAYNLVTATIPRYYMNPEDIKKFMQTKEPICAK